MFCEWLGGVREKPVLKPRPILIDLLHHLMLLLLEAFPLQPASEWLENPARLAQRAFDNFFSLQWSLLPVPPGEIRSPLILPLMQSAG